MVMKDITIIIVFIVLMATSIVMCSVPPNKTIAINAGEISGKVESCGLNTGEFDAFVRSEMYRVSSNQNDYESAIITFNQIKRMTASEGIGAFDSCKDAITELYKYWGLK